MKRRELVRHLLQEGCVLSREGGKYSVFMNPKAEMKKEVPVTRHNEIADFTVRKICRDLGINPPR
ncbi:MAG: type II toxin-antitoxin system HicA family toxin [Elusimicrobia bacterium]|nr:type II toxin-antitoxin system HicA family toxin [Elusimicrobiota bacterium]